MNQSKDTSLTELEERLHFETLLTELSTSFVSLPAAAVDDQIGRAQRLLCEALDLDRSTLWQLLGNEEDTLLLTHAYSPTDEIVLEPLDPNNYSDGDRSLDLKHRPPINIRMDAKAFFPWVLEQVRSGKTVILKSLDDLPKHAGRDREFFTKYGTKSSVIVPLAAGGHWLGCLSFASLREEKTWSDATIKRLSLIGDLFSNALVRKHTENKLRENEERLLLAAESANVHIWEYQAERGVFLATKNAKEFYGLAPSEDVPLDQFLGFVLPEDRQAVQQALQNSTESSEGVAVEFRVIGRDGSLHWKAASGSSVQLGAGLKPRVLGVTLEITELKLTQEAARALTGRLIQAQEEERARLARELHDDITQRLARLAIDVGRIEGTTSETKVRGVMSEVRNGLVRISEDVHALSYRLHPSILEDLGLIEALRTECERFTRVESIPVRVTMPELPEAVSSDAALALFRIAEEALRNIACHAQASLVELTLLNLEGGLQLAVRDNGCGFDPSARGRKPSLGHASMRERVHLIGGELDIESAPGQGTTVIAWVPLQGGLK